MSKSALWSIIACLTAGLAFFVWLHYAETALIDSMLRCVAAVSLGMSA